MEDHEKQIEAWLELERAAIKAELQLGGRDQTESDPELIAKFSAAVELRRQADALLNEILGGVGSFPSP